MQVKQCSRCGNKKPVEDFGRYGGGRYCFGCAAAIQREYYAKSEKNRERKRTYKSKNREKLNKQARERYAENIAEERAWQRDYYARTCCERKACARRRRQEKPEITRANKARRRALHASARGSCSPEQLKARFDYHGNRCIYCGCGGRMTVEHLIPLSRGGTNWPANLAPSCKGCNSSKRDKTYAEFISQSQRWHTYIT